MRFVDEVEQSFPPGLGLPPAFRQALEWTEENGCVHAYTRVPGRYASLYPGAPRATGASHVAFVPVDPGYAEAWIGHGVPGVERIAPFIRTGGDGSYAALWLDPADRPCFVHIGTGSGSSWPGVITDDPVEMLRFLTIGYDEACWPSEFDKTPLEVWEGSEFRDDAAYELPRQFQEWVSTTFGVPIPARGREVVRHAPNMDDDGADDAFLRWLRAVQDDA